MFIRWRMYLVARAPTIATLVDAVNRVVISFPGQKAALTLKILRNALASIVGYARDSPVRTMSSRGMQSLMASSNMRVS